MAQEKSSWSLLSKQLVRKQIPSHTMALSFNSWLCCAMPSASLAEIRGHCIWPLLSERLPSPFLVPRIRREMVLTARAVVQALLRAISFCAARVRRPLTNEATRLLLLSWKSPSMRSSKQFAGAFDSVIHWRLLFFGFRGPHLAAWCSAH